MRPRFTLFSIVAILVASGLLPAQTAVRYDQHQVIRAWLETEEELATLLSLTTDVWSERIGVGALDVRISPAALPALAETDIEYTVLIEDVQALVDGSQPGAQPFGGTWFEDYRTYDEVVARLLSLEAMRPDLASVIELGHSLEGRAILGLQIHGSTGSSRPGVYLQSCQHAREWISVMTSMYFADALLQRYDLDPEIQALVDSVEFTIVPIVNPDGYVYSHTTERLWRKNRRDNGDGTFGVDLNRNWSVDWGGVGSSEFTSSNIFHGAFPFSEPETQAVANYLLAHPEIRAVVDIHSYSQLILQPWAYTTDPHPDHPFFDDLGGVMSAEIYAVHDEVYLHGSGASILYIASGVAPDWAVGELDVIGLTIELRDTGEFGFLLPPSEIIPTGEETLPALLHLAEVVNEDLTFSFPEERPSLIPVGGTTEFPVHLYSPNGSNLDPSSPKLFYRVSPNDSFTSVPLDPTSGAEYRVSLPDGPCGGVVQYYLQAETLAGASVLSPPNAPTSLHEATSLEEFVTFADDFQTDLGWQTSGTALEGHWTRGIPIGGGLRGDPPADADGSGRCYLTDNSSGNSDVDEGNVVLLSPPLPTAGVDSYVEYERWYSNVGGASPEQDVFVVEISPDDGQSWTALEIVGPGGPEVHGGWYSRSFRVLNFVPASREIRIRFTASDFGEGSVVEAAVDAVRVVSYSCGGEPYFVRGDANADGNYDISDPILTLNHLFASGPVACDHALDANDDDTLNLSDAFFSLGAIFGTGSLPSAPFPTCGPDPTGGALGCESFAYCP